MAESEKPKTKIARPGAKLMLVLIVCTIIGGYFLISRPDLFSEIRQKMANLFSGQGSTNEPEKPQAPLRSDRGNEIRVATFNAGPLDEMKLSSVATVEHLANTIRNFDIIALQNIHVRDPGKLNLIIKRLNSRGRYYDYVVSPGLVSNSGAFNALLYDAASVEVDRDKVFDYVDRHGRLAVRPLSALFRVRGPKPDQALTFVAISAYVNPAEREAELELLPEVLDKAKKYYLGEDDFILCASLQASPPHLGALGHMPNIMVVAENCSNLVQGNALTDNILFDRRATNEYTSDWGVYDLGRRLQLKPTEIAKVTGHLPVWAKFNIYEGARFIK